MFLHAFLACIAFQRVILGTLTDPCSQGIYNVKEGSDVREMRGGREGCDPESLYMLNHEFGNEEKRDKPKYI